GAADPRRREAGGRRSRSEAQRCSCGRRRDPEKAFRGRRFRRRRPPPTGGRCAYPGRRHATRRPGETRPRDRPPATRATRPRSGGAWPRCRRGSPRCRSRARRALRAGSPSAGSGGVFVFDAPFGQGDVLGVGVVADVPAVGTHGRNSRLTGAPERVERDIAKIRVEVDETFGQLDRERCRMTDAPGVFGADLPHVKCRREELLLRDRVLERQTSLLPIRPADSTIEATLTGYDDAL